MSKDAYYQGGSRGVEGLSLPSFPTTTFWYDAHSSVGSCMYAGSEAPGVPAYKSQHQVDSKLTENSREFLDWWTDGLCLGNQQRPDGRYWEGNPAKQGFAPLSDRVGAGSELELSEQQLVLLNCDASDPEFMSTEDIVRHDQDEESMCYESNSSQAYSPASGYNETTINNKKHSPEPLTAADEHKRSQKRQRKEAKEKAKEDKRCGVCGDAARSMHFGGMACDSCKAFFRRSVQSGAYKTFQCPDNKTCLISKQNRKVCQ